MEYHPKLHASAFTESYLFNQLIPYIGNKRKLLGVIQAALRSTDAKPGETFLDLFAGSGVVARLANTLGFRVIANDWEPYAEILNQAALTAQTPICEFAGGYAAAIDQLNQLPGVRGWVTSHLCPQSDEAPNPDCERMFYMRKNGERIDAMREQIENWFADGRISVNERACLLAPLLFQACYASNTSGVFKGFHRGWGGQTKTALYRIARDVRLAPALFWPNTQQHQVFCRDAQQVVDDRLGDKPVAVAYLDPPYNQHPYASNYHVLNTITLWDQPSVPMQITAGTKSAIRTDWRQDRRSAYNYRSHATTAYERLIQSINARWILTSYSTDGTIPLDVLVAANCRRGDVQVQMRSYKRYRVSSQRYSNRPHTIEYVLITETDRPCRSSAAATVDQIRSLAAALPTGVAPDAG